METTCRGLSLVIPQKLLMDKKGCGKVLDDNGMKKLEIFLINYILHDSVMESALDASWISIVLYYDCQIISWVCWFLMVRYCFCENIKSLVKKIVSISLSWFSSTGIWKFCCLSQMHNRVSVWEVPISTFWILLYRHFLYWPHKWKNYNLQQIMIMCLNRWWCWTA